MCTCLFFREIGITRRRLMRLLSARVLLNLRVLLSLSSQHDMRIIWNEWIMSTKKTNMGNCNSFFLVLDHWWVTSADPNIAFCTYIQWRDATACMNDELKWISTHALSSEWTLSVKYKVENFYLDFNSWRLLLFQKFCYWFWICFLTPLTSINFPRKSSSSWREFMTDIRKDENLRTLDKIKFEDFVKWNSKPRKFIFCWYSSDNNQATGISSFNVNFEIFKNLISRLSKVCWLLHLHLFDIQEFFSGSKLNVEWMKRWNFIFSGGISFPFLNFSFTSPKIHWIVV